MRFVIPTGIALLLLYLVWGTGIHGDDYPLIQHAQSVGFWGYLWPNPSELSVLVFGPGSYYLQYFAFYFFGSQHLLGYDLLKFVVSGASIWLTYRFATDYLPRERAALAAILFILLITHDATLYWVGTLMYVLCPAMIMYAHHLIRHEKTWAGMIVGTLGAFSTYASPPYTFGLGVIFLLERAYKKALLFMAPGLLYVVYYFAVSHIPGISKGRINADLTPGIFAKQYLLQVGSFLDSAVGPSFWLKLWYSGAEISLTSLLVAGVVLVIFFRSFQGMSARFSRPLVTGLIAVVVLAFAMFALTGLYPQMAFNMGNRVMVYGSLFMAFLLAMLPVGRKGYLVLVAAFLVSVLGLSDHWKEWNARQLEVIAKVQSNPSLMQLNQDDVLLVTGHTFSKLGPFSHIEFFSESYMAGSVFRHALGHALPYTVVSINRRYYVEGDKLIDRKYGSSTQLGREVVIYDSEKNTVTRLPVSQLAEHLASLQPDVRHWIQLLGEGWLKSVALGLMPRLKYLFE